MVKIICFILKFSLFAVFGSNAFAQSVIGTSSINGKQIEIFDDNTWRYIDNLKNLSCADLVIIDQNVSFCNTKNWQTQPNNPVTDAIYRIDDRTYAAFVVEQLGKTDGLTPQTVVDMAYQQAANAMNVTQKNLDVLYSKGSTIDGKLGLETSYKGKIDGLNVTFINSIYVGQRYTAQLVTWGIGDVSSSQKAVHQTLLANTYLEP